MAQYVYTMNRVGKIVPPKREILKDISLSFFPGAKIIELTEPYNTTKNIMTVADQFHHTDMPPVKIDKLKEGEAVTLYIAYDESDEIDYMINEMRYLNERRTLRMMKWQYYTVPNLKPFHSGKR